MRAAGAAGKKRHAPTGGALVGVLWALCRRPMGALLVVMMLGWQLAAVAHLVLVPHTLCSEHGSVSHHDGHTGSPLHDHQSDSEGDECPVLTALVHTNAGLESPPAIEILEAELDLQLPVTLVDRFVAQGRDRYRLSPSLSPPPHV